MANLPQSAARFNSKILRSLGLVVVPTGISKSQSERIPPRWKYLPIVRRILPQPSVLPGNDITIMTIKPITKFIGAGIIGTALFLTFLPCGVARQTNDVQQGEEPKRKFFEFNGGTPLELVHAIDLHFRTRLIQILSLPEMLRGAEVPKFRVAAKEPREVFHLYNSLDNPELGHWRYEPTVGPATTNLNVLALMPDKTVATAQLQKNLTRVEAVPLGDIPTNKWDNLAETIQVAAKLREQVGQTASHGSYYLQKESRILVVAGSEPYIDTIVSVVKAYKVNSDTEAGRAQSVTSTNR
jgi:hypothetical protein